MLLVLNYVFVAALTWGILSSGSSTKAAAYLLISGLLTLPVFIIGNSVNAAVFAIDIAMCAFVFRGARRAARIMAPGRYALVALALIASVSAVLNYLFIEPAGLRFYLFTAIKFVQYAIVATTLARIRFDRAEGDRAARLIVIAVCSYQFVHLLHLLDIVPLSGAEYFGARAADIESRLFEDRQSWFLTAIKATAAGIASVNFWLLFATSVLVHGTIRKLVYVGMALCAVCVLGTTSRSDLAGLIAGGATCIALLKGRRRFVWATGSVLVASGALFAMIAVWNARGDEASVERLAELVDASARTQGSYADRTTDRASLPAHLISAPRDLLIGSGPGFFRRYREQGVTINAMGHNSYLHWLGELGIGGLFGVIAWCGLVIRWFVRAARRARTDTRAAVIAPAAASLLVGRCVAAWGAESLFGTDGMGYYSIYMVAVVYFLVALLREEGGSVMKAGQWKTVSERHVASMPTQVKEATT